jgi:hypothetical protein
MWSMQSNVEFGYQLSICSGTKENHGKLWSIWPVAGPSRCKLTSSQQSGTEHANPNICPWLCSCFVGKINGYIVPLQFLYVWLSTKQCITSGGNEIILITIIKFMRGLLLLQLQWLCDALQFHCSVFRRIVDRCHWVCVASAGLDFPRIEAACEYLDCGYQWTHLFPFNVCSRGE